MTTAASTTCGIIVAAGRSERMGGVDKVFAPVAGRPLIAWTIAAFQKCDTIDGIVVVAAPDAVERMRALVSSWRFSKVRDVVAGGDARQDSVRAGIDAAAGAAFVAVHDGARPLVMPEHIAACVALARKHGAAICAARARDTVKEVDADDAPPVVVRTHDRARTWLAQTPQAFDRQLLASAHAAASQPVTDDAALVEAAGARVVICETPYWNLKITTTEDLALAEELLRRRFEEN